MRHIRDPDKEMRYVDNRGSQILTGISFCSKRMTIGYDPLVGNEPCEDCVLLEFQWKAEHA